MMLVKQQYFIHKNSGFTLTELTIVLVIVALLIGGMMLPLSAQRDAQNTNDARRQLAEIKEALLGFAAINGRFPCPSLTTVSALTDPKYGVEDPDCADTEGYLPWKTLGVSETDPWGTQRTKADDPFLGYWHYRVDKTFSKKFQIDSAPTPASALIIEDSSGNTLTVASPSPVAIIYSTGPDLVANGKNILADTTFEASDRSPNFDDITVWISRPLLINRMITAGKLP